MYHSIWTPSIADLKAAIHMNAITNSPVTTADVDLAEKIFGPDIATIKGKATQQKPMPVTSGVIEIPKELIAAQQDVTLCMDDMKVNGLWFLTSISRNIYYRTAQYVMKKEATEYLEAIEEIIAIYNRAGFCLA